MTKLVLNVWSINVLYFTVFTTSIFLSSAKSYADSKQVIERINANYNRIETLYGRIIRRYELNGQGHRTAGRFYFKKPAQISIEYAKPEKTVILNDSTLWLYLPEEKQVIKMNYNKFSHLEKQSIGLETFFGFVSLSGLEQDFNFELKGNYLTAYPKHTPKIISKMVYEIDTRRYIILKTKLFNLQGELIAETSYEDWGKHEGGVWFPQDITSTVFADGKEIVEKISFRGLFINYDIDSSIFNFILPKGVQLIEQ